MNAKKLFLIVLIFVGASVAWQVLGQSTLDRTNWSEKKLGADVARMYGPRLVQTAPRMAFEPADGENATWRPPDASEIHVAFDHENRYRGLIWFSLYEVDFDATYTFRLDEEVDEAEVGRFRMELPADANIDALQVQVAGRDLQVDKAEIDTPLYFDGEGSVTVRVRYVSAGQDSWAYRPRTDDGGLRNFRLTARTDFDDVDYPSTGLSPTEKAAPLAEGGTGRLAEWRYRQMLPARNHTIGILMPSRPSAGYLAARLSTFAPVSLFFFFVVLVVIQLLKSWKLHPINYLLLAAAFFAFHILLAYLVDHVALQPSFWISALASVLLVVSYLRLVLGAQQAVFVAGAAQLVYLVFFSYAFFWQGWTGLTIVIGAVLTLFVIMQLTGRIDWDAKFPDLARARGRREKAVPEAATTDA